MSAPDLPGSIPESDAEEGTTPALFIGDSGTLDSDTRRAIVKLLRGPFLDGDRAPELWAALKRAEPAVRRHLSEIFLVLVVDDAERIAFTQQGESDDAIPTVLRQIPLTMIDSALVLFLRQQLTAAAGTGQRAIVGFDDITAQLSPYRREGSTDDRLQSKRISGALTKMIDNGVLAKTSTAGRYEVSPVLRLLFPAEQISALVQAYERIGGDSTTSVELPIPEREDSE